jgi:hypothetical protein
VFGAVAGAGDPDEEIVVQKVVPTRPELSLEIGVLWLGLGGGGWMSISLFAAACCGCNPAAAAAAASTVFFSLWIAAAAIQTAATVSACSQPNTPYLSLGPLPWLSGA